MSESSTTGGSSTKRAAPQPEGWIEKIPETKRLQGRTKRTRALQRKRGDGEIFDVIDDWLAPAVARWIANQRSHESSD